MRLRNKKTGEVVKRIDLVIREEGVVFNIDEQYHSLAELNEEWEDYYEEPKPWWYIDITLVVKQGELFLSKHVEQFKTVGNYFETREEAEQAVEKLKAWKRLKDKGFRFTNWEKDENYPGDITIEAVDVLTTAPADLNLLFGGEE